MKSDSHRKSEERVSVAEVIARLIKGFGIKHVYGAPGTTEIRLIRAILDCDLEYHFIPSDATAVGIADGFTRAAQTIGVVNLHASQGLLNATGFIRVALRDRIPLLVLVGMPATDYEIYEPNHFTHHLSQAVTPLAKWAWSVNNPTTVKKVIQRAVTIAMTPPQGPVVIMIPQDILESDIEIQNESDYPPVLSSYENRPSEKASQELAMTLVQAQHPLLFVGWGARHARQKVEQLSDLIAAPIIGESLDRGTQVHAMYSTYEHAFFLGYFNAQDNDIRTFINTADVIAFIGTRATYPRVIGELPRNCRILQFSAVGNEMGKDFVVDTALVSDVAAGLSDVLNHVESNIARDDLAEIKVRKTSLSCIIKERHQKQKKILETLAKKKGSIRGEHLIKTMNEVLPEDTIIVDDSQCIGYYLKRFYRLWPTGDIFGSLAGHIGWGLSAAVGIKHAWTSRLIVCLTGDMGCFFALQALASATVLRTPLLVIVANNFGSVSLRTEARAKNCLDARTDQVLKFHNSKFDFAGIAGSLGFRGFTVRNCDDLRRDLQKAVAIVQKRDIPCLLNVLMSNDIKDWKNAWSTPNE